MPNTYNGFKIIIIEHSEYFFFFIFNIDFLAASCEKVSKLEMFLKIPWKVSKKSINVSRDLTDKSQSY